MHNEAVLPLFIICRALWNTSSQDSRIDLISAVKQQNGKKCALISRGNLYGTDQRNGALNQKWVACLNQTGAANDLYPILIVASQTVETNRVGIHADDLFQARL